MPSRTYEITFVGEVGTILQAEFDDCEVSVGAGTTTLHSEIPDQGALHGLLQRIVSFGLELIDVSVVPPVDVRHETSESPQAQFRQANETMMTEVSLDELVPRRLSPYRVPGGSEQLHR